MQFAEDPLSESLHRLLMVLQDEASAHGVGFPPLAVFDVGTARWLLAAGITLEDEAEARFEDFAERWEPIYPAMIQSWRNSWGEFIPFLWFPVEIRKLVYTTNAIESLNDRFRAATRRHHFPNEQTAMKVLRLAVIERRHSRAKPTGEVHGWKAILNALATAYGDRPGLNWSKPVTQENRQTPPEWARGL
jgi:hypothetical protein